MRKSFAVVLLVSVVACGGGSEDRVFKPEQLKGLLLRAEEAPVGTELDASASGPRELVRFTGDSKYQRKLEGAGFVTSYFMFFHNQLKSRTAALTVVADSYAILFKDALAAQRGMEIIEEHIRSDGQDLRNIPAEGLGEDSLGVAGNFDPGGILPPGFQYIWRIGNVVFGLVGAGPENTIRENAVRALAERMEARAH